MSGARRAAVAVLMAAALTSTSAPIATAVIGAPETSGLGFTVRLDIGIDEESNRACSGALVAPDWILTASSCFAADPALGHEITAGSPPQVTTATVGRADQTSSAGEQQNVVELVPHASRDLVLARLAGTVTGVAPVRLGTTAPTVDDELRISGFGRTATEWSPLQRHGGTFTADAVVGDDLPLTGVDGAVVCAGDTGAPVLRPTDGSVELVGVATRSWQGGCFGADPAETRTGAVAARTDDITDWVGATTNSARIVDFNCDGLRDIAVADPNATVDGIARAGLVRVIYGGGAGSVEIRQGSGGVGGGPETDDRFGFSLATYDRNLDGCTDLVIGTPYEHLNNASGASQADTGWVQVVHGDRDGLTHGPRGAEYAQGQGTGQLATAVKESGDQTGYSLAAGHTTDGTPFLVIGAPGEGVGSLAAAGAVYYILGDRIPRAISQDTGNLGGSAEAGERFGSTLAGDSHFVAIGTPKETIGSAVEAGSVHVLSHGIGTDGYPRYIAGLNQESGGDSGISGGSETGDEFGGALDLVAYRPQGAATATDSLLAVGSPGEGLTNASTGTVRPDAGRVVVLRLTASGAWSEIKNIEQNQTGVSGDPEANDRMGATVALTNTEPTAVATSETVHVAIGVPGETVGGVSHSGLVQVYSPLGSLAATEFQLVAGTAGLPGTAGAEQRLGSVLTGTETHLYVGMPYGPSRYGSVHAVPWANLTAGASQAVSTYQPGIGGLPAAGADFGFAVR
jgi:hypothetical protein